MATVVIADDSPTLRRVVSAVLGRAGHAVVVAEDGIGAVQAVLAHRPDVVVLDVQMPRLSGYAASRLLKEDWRTAGIPVVLLTSLDAAGDRYWGAQNGADRYLTKDFEAGELVAAVEALAASSRPEPATEPVDVTDGEVLTAVCDLLDRKLFEASVTSAVTELATSAHGLPDTAAGLLDLLHLVVGFDAAALAVPAMGEVFLARRSAVGTAFLDDVAGRAAAAAGIAPDAVRLLVDRPGDGEHAELDEEAAIGTVLSMPLRSGNRPAAVVTLAVEAAEGFGETALGTLRLAAAPAALVLDNARLADG